MSKLHVLAAKNALTAASQMRWCVDNIVNPPLQKECVNANGKSYQEQFIELHERVMINLQALAEE